MQKSRKQSSAESSNLPAPEDALKRVLWRCRRGTKELDLILEHFCSRCYLELSEPDRESFHGLLETPDPQLSEWLCNDAVPTEEFWTIVQKIRAAKIAM